MKLENTTEKKYFVYLEPEGSEHVLEVGESIFFDSEENPTFDMVMEINNMGDQIAKIWQEVGVIEIKMTDNL